MSTRALLTAVSIALMAAVSSLPAVAAVKSPSQGVPPTHSLLQSRQLWATVNLCNPADHPLSVGIRGSMPGDGKPRDRMFMRFRVQYLDPTGKHWIDVGKSADSGLLAIGPAASPLQGGHSFQFVATPDKPAFTVRGVVSFQWRRGKLVVHTATRVSSAPHRSLAGADPLGFTAATCALG